MVPASASRRNPLYRLLLYLPLFMCADMFAQSVSGDLQFNLRDSLRAPISGANVAVTGPQLQGIRGTVSDDSGRCQILALPPGIFDVRISHPAYHTIVFENIGIRLGKSTSLGEILLRESVPAMAEVVVLANRPVIDPFSTTAGLNISDSRFEALPIGRSYLEMMQLAPQSSPSFYGDGTNIAGATGIENRYFLDGADVTDPWRGVSGTQLPYNFIREVQIRSGAYEAEYQSSLGGVVNAVTYSGGNEIHGQAFGFYTNNRFSESPRTVLGQAPMGEFSEYDVGLSIGGPIVRDRLWYFLAYNPRFVREVVPVSGQADQNDHTTTHRFATKLTWTANESNFFSLSVSGDPSTREAVGITFNGNIYPYRVLDLNAWLSDVRTGSTSFALNGTHRVGSSLLLESSISSVGKKDEYNPVGNSGPYWYVDLPANTVGGTLYRTFEKTTNFHAGIRGTLILGGQTMKAGIEYSESSYEAEDVWHILIKYSDSSYTYYYRNFAGKAAIRNPSLFVQDSWQVSERFTLNAGVRWDPQFMIASDGEVAQEIMGGFAPRFGVIFQPGELCSEKISASFGRFYQPLSLSLPTAYHIKSVQTYDVYYTHDPRIDTSGATSGPNLFSFYGHVPGLKGQYYDEITLGYEREIVSLIKASARLVYRTLGQAVEDGYSTKASRLVYGNPGSPPMDEYPRATRKYLATELALEYASPSGLSFQVSYVLSRNYGNYEGLADATYSSFASGTEFWPNTSIALQVPAMMINTSGLLPDDRTHAFKFFGSYAFPFGLTMGLSGYWTSGTPLNELGVTPPPLSEPAFLQKRGSVGRTPSIWDLNLRVVGDFGKLMNLEIHPRLILDVLHLFSQKRAVQYDEQHYWTSDANGNQLDANPNYGIPIQFQLPMSVRLGVEGSF